MGASASQEKSLDSLMTSKNVQVAQQGGRRKSRGKRTKRSKRCKHTKRGKHSKRCKHTKRSH